MKLQATFFISTMLLVQSVTDARAQVTRLFTLSNIQQSIDTSYRFDGDQGTLASTTQNGLQEDYHFSIDYALYKARLLHGQIALDLQGNQKTFSNAGQSTDFTSGVGFLYDINGVFLDRFPYPVTFFLNSNITQVPREFASNYEQKTDSYGVGVSLSNRFVPVAFNYSHSTSETSGLQSDRTQSSDSISFGASHSYKQKSQTQFTIIDTNQTTSIKGGGGSEETGNLEVTLNNNLTFSTKDLNRMLYSRVRLNDQTGLNVSRSTEIGESLAWDLGKALTSGVDYTYTRRESTGQDHHNNTARMWLQHRLFKSLTSRVDLSGTDNHLSSGSEQTASGSVSLAYQKILPGESMIQLQGHQQYGISSNELNDSKVPVDPPENYNVTGAETLLTLAHPNVVSGTIEVWNAAMTLRYQENGDYQVSSQGSQTQILILVNGVNGIKAGDKLAIKYQYLVNSNVKYGTVGHGLAGDLSLLDNRYRIFASWDSTDQHLISGSADQVNLAATDTYRAGVERRFEGGSLTAEYNATNSDNDKNQSVNGLFIYSGPLGEGTYSLTTNERYVLNETNPLTSNRRTKRSENILSAGGSYTRTLESAAILTATASYLNSRGFANNDNLSLALSLRWNLRRMTISLLTQANLRLNAGNLSTDEHLQLRLSRYF